MSKNRKFSKLTLEELYQKRKYLQSVLIGLGLLMTIAIVLLIHFALKSGNYALIVVGIASITTLLPIVIILNQINSEIESR